MPHQQSASTDLEPRRCTLPVLLLAAALLLPACCPPAVADATHSKTARRRNTDCQLLLTEKRLLGWDVSKPRAKIQEARTIGLAGDLTRALVLLDEAERELRFIDSWQGNPKVIRIMGEERRPKSSAEDGAATGLTTGPLGLGFDTAGRLTRVTLGGEDRQSPVSGGFYIMDAATGKVAPFSGRVTQTGGGLDLSGTIPAVSANLEARIQKKEGWLEVDGTLKDISGADRAMVLCFKIPLRREGLLWWDDPEQGMTIQDKPVIRQNSAQVTHDDKSTRLVSIYPLACAGDQRTGLALATAIDHPTAFRINYDGQDQSINLYYDFGLTSKTAKFPGEARFRFVIYPLEEPAWGFRSALHTYYRIFPEAFADTVKDPGLWGTVEAAALLGEEYKKMGFGFLQGENGHPKWGKKLGLYSLRYGRPWSFLIPGATGSAESQLAALTADPARLNLKPSHTLIFGPVSAREMVAGAELSAIHDHAGKPVSVTDRSLGGAKIILNPDPEIEGGRGGKNAARLTLAKAISPAVDTYKSGGQQRWGVFLDVAGTSLKHENFRQDHMAWADYPLTFDEREKRPVILGLSSACEYLVHLRDWAGRRGGMVAVNTSPHPYNMIFLAPFCDMAGTEHLPGRREMYNRRALAGGKPIGFRTKESWDALLKTGLFFGCYPSRNPPGAVRTRLDHLDGVRPQLTRLVPLIKNLDNAGWQPVTRARTGHRDLPVERFGDFGDGPVYLTVWNRTPSASEVALNLDETASRWCGDTPRASELAMGLKVSTAAGVIRLQLGADQVAVIRLVAAGE